MLVHVNSRLFVNCVSSSDWKLSHTLHILLIALFSAQQYLKLKNTQFQLHKLQSVRALLYLKSSVFVRLYRQNYVCEY